MEYKKWCKKHRPFYITAGDIMDRINMIGSCPDYGEYPIPDDVCVGWRGPAIIWSVVKTLPPVCL